jgi:fructose-1,6-bisphosphatase II
VAGQHTAGPFQDHELALALVRLTEAAATAAARWVGRGDKNAADAAAVDAMRAAAAALPVHGTVVIGEGEKDEAPMLHNGEEIGDPAGPAWDVAVDPIDGTTLTARGGEGALSVLALAPAGSLYDPAGVFYMDKLVTGPAAADAVDIEAPVAHNVRAVAAAKGIRTDEVTVCVLDRPRHTRLVADLRACGARVRLVSDGDVAGAVLAAREGSGVDLLLGIGGTPEGVVTACALKALGGVIQGRLWAPDDAGYARARAAGHDMARILTTGDLVAADDAFFAATGITDGPLLHGVRHGPHAVTTASVVMRARTRAVAFLTSEHRPGHLSRAAA